jgi:hypothetical protein
MQKSRRGFGNFIHSSLKRLFVSLRRFAEPAYFPHELQRGIPNFFRCHRRIKVEQNFDVPAHRDHLKTSQSAIISHRTPPAIPNNQPPRSRRVTKYDNQKRRLVTIRSHRLPIASFTCCKETPYARRVAKGLLPCPTCHPAPLGASVSTHPNRTPPKCPPTRKWATGTRN